MKNTLFLKILILISVLLGFNGNCNAIGMDFRGQLSGWATGSRIHHQWEHNGGIRYIPTATLEHSLDGDSTLGIEISLDCYAVSGSQPHEDDSRMNFYRANIRYATIQTETLLGLQKINFGPARLLRSLRWFDLLEPTDPLQFTEGVKAFRFRYDSLDNSNYWIWCLYDNDDPKGYETLRTKPHTLEPGGRIQYPLLDGDVAMTFHSRKVDGSAFRIPGFRENRYALDGRWDIGIGLWFEAVLQEQKSGLMPFEYSKRATIGLDYTIDVGNGIYFLVEHMDAGFSKSLTGWDESINVSAFSVSYPIGILDNLKAVGYYYWNQDKYWQHLNWTRNYDRLTVSFSLTYAPDISGMGTAETSSNLLGSRSGQLMLILNH